MKKSYDIINEIFSDKNCELYTSKVEYDLMQNTNRNKFYFRASCGHDNNVTLTNFIQKGSGVTCKECMKKRVSNKLVEYQRLEQKTNYDLEMLQENGWCQGIENYSSQLEFRKPGSAPFSLIDYFLLEFIFCAL